MLPVNPDSLAAPRGYNNGMLSKPGRILFIAGQVGWNRDGEFVDGLVGQFEQAVRNILDVVNAAGGTASDIGRFTIYIKDKSEYLAYRKQIGEVYRKWIGRHYPAMSLLIVNDLLEDGALVEIEATAVIP
jgi:enamine deaminase RidA (YjgF/YER057c/UK114 family)